MGVFAGKQGLITLRDLFKWAGRYAHTEGQDRFNDWEQTLAEDGEGGRVVGSAWGRDCLNLLKWDTFCQQLGCLTTGHSGAMTLKYIAALYCLMTACDHCEEMLFIMLIQWNLSIKDTPNKGHLSNKDTVSCPNHIELCTNLRTYL